MCLHCNRSDKHIRKTNLRMGRMFTCTVKRVVALSNITGDTKLTVSYEDGSALPRGTTNPDIATFLISGIEAVSEKYATTGKVRQCMMIMKCD